jgi:hypothetical protein
MWEGYQHAGLLGPPERRSAVEPPGYQKKWVLKDPFRLHLNAYRVLLTRAREVTLVFVPPIPVLDETFEYLRSAGFRLLRRVTP